MNTVKLAKHRVTDFRCSVSLLHNPFRNKESLPKHQSQHHSAQHKHWYEEIARCLELFTKRVCEVVPILFRKRACPGLDSKISGICTSLALDGTTPLNESKDEYYEWTTEDEACDEQKAVEICGLFISLCTVSMFL